MNRFSIFSALVFLVAGFSIAQDKAKKADEEKEKPAAKEETGPVEGHSVHGEVFNKGPRQAAVLLEGMPDVHFPVTTESKEAQRFFDQGIGQLHGFWDFEAERSFRQAAAIDPDCAMAYWGMAMANFGNNERGKGFADEAAKRKEKANEWEKMWIDGIATYFKDVKADKKKRLRDLVRSMEKIAAKFPDEIEAEAFLLKQIYYNHRNGHPVPSHYAVNLLGKSIMDKDPDHPAHHYRIHLWDREDAAQALDSAAACGPSSPGIAHMWHMPGHIYSKLHRYDDGAWQQEASARVDHAHMIRYQLIPDTISNFAHNNEWCIRNFNFLGRVHDAIDLAKNMAEMPRLPKFKTKEDPSTYNPSGSSWQYGRQRLRETLFRFEQWDTLIALADSHYLKPDGKGLTQDDHDRFIGIAKFEKGDAEGGKKHLAELEKRMNAEKKKRDDAVANAEKKAKDAKKKEKEIESAKKSAERQFAKKVEALETRFNELSVYAAVTSEPKDLKKAHELLPKLKNMAKERHARLWMRADKLEEAEKLVGEAVSGGKNQVVPLATQVAILHTAGKTDEAKKAFELLRDVAAYADMEVPLFQRLAPVAKEFGFPEKWANAPKVATDLGDRPDPDSLGPFRWSPPLAAKLELPNAKGETVKLSDQKGKPTLVIFYLGGECAHCMEQLNAFSPLNEKFAKAGIEILTVSTDPLESVSKIKQESGDPFPFVMLSDASLDTFKAYRAYDDFEKMALHGTFLIDGDGHVRWHDISYEPFMHGEWLLEECKRLLSFGKS